MRSETCLALAFALAGLIGACTAQAPEGTVPLTPDADLTVQTVASASCTRGNNPVVLTVASDGRATGKIVGSKQTFSGTLIASDPGTVVFIVEEGALQNERLEQAMQPSVDGDTVLLLVGDFVCKDVFVRSAG